MRRILVSTVLVLALAGCGGTGSIVRASSSSDPGTTGASSTPADSSTSSSPTGSDGGTGCGALTKEDLATFILDTQLMAQIRDQAGLDSITSGTIGRYSPEEFGAVLAKLGFLTGAAGEGVATLATANELVKALVAGSPSQADFDAYQKQIGGISGILKAQLAVNLGIAQNCPNLG